MNPKVMTGEWVKSFIYPFILSFIASQHPVFYAYGMEGILFDPDIEFPCFFSSIRCKYRYWLFYCYRWTLKVRISIFDAKTLDENNLVSS